jgi:hypothetical protein
MPFAERCPSHLSGSGALVVTRMAPGLSGFEGSSTAIWADADRTSKPVHKDAATIDDSTVMEVFIFARESPVVGDALLAQLELR